MQVAIDSGSCANVANPEDLPGNCTIIPKEPHEKDFMVQVGCPNTRTDATFTKALAGKGNAPPNTEFVNLVTGDKLRRNSRGCIDDE